jgi:hypothetical protein
MSKFRKDLIRANFEAYRDLTWAETLEPRLKEYDLDPDEMKQYREEWNAHTEKNDWPWFRNQAKSMSVLQLDNERMDCIDKLDALGTLQWQRDNATTGTRRFEEILSDVGSNEKATAEQIPSVSKTREM